MISFIIYKEPKDLVTLRAEDWVSAQVEVKLEVSTIVCPARDWLT
jgi:hypothetical protein